jgi:transposase
MVPFPAFSPAFRQQLIARYKAQTKARFAARLHCLLLKDEGYSHQEIAQILHVNPNTITVWLRLFHEGGLERLCQMHIKGRTARLSPQQLAALEEELARQPFSSAKEVAAWVKEQLGIAYSERGMQALLKRHGFTLQQVRPVPGKADPTKQAFF